ncbi:MAG: amidohydrolase family protein [Steroidobacteraceae bacterium]
MKLSKREFLQAAAAGMALYASGSEAQTNKSKRNYLRISCEEAFSTPEIVAELSRLAGGVPSMKSGPIAGPFMKNLLDIGEGRVKGMDADGVDIQVLSLSSPGVQTFAPATAVSMARQVNDQMAEVIKKYPTRFGGLATIAPQAPAETVKELERCIKTLKLNGGIINSHTNGEYLDDKKYWPILEAFEALDVPLYIHPRDPSPGLEGPLAIQGFAVGWGYAVETGTHALRMIAGGVFDQFPKLRIVLGHLGETLPFLLDRIDNRYQWQFNTFGLKPTLKRLPSEYFRDNFVVATSGMNYSAPVLAALAAMGPDKVLFAADHPMEVQKDAVDEMEAIKLSVAVKKKVFETNARRVFKI